MPVWQPLVTLIAIYVFFSAILLVNPHVIRSIYTYMLFGFCQIYLNLPPVILAGCLFMAMIIVARHLPSCHGEAVTFRLIEHLRIKRQTGLTEQLRAKRHEDRLTRISIISYTPYK